MCPGRSRLLTPGVRGSRWGHQQRRWAGSRRGSAVGLRLHMAWRAQGQILGVPRGYCPEATLNTGPGALWTRARPPAPSLCWGHSKGPGVAAPRLWVASSAWPGQAGLTQRVWAGAAERAEGVTWPRAPPAGETTWDAWPRVLGGRLASALGCRSLPLGPSEGCRAGGCGDPVFLPGPSLGSCLGLAGAPGVARRPEAGVP